MRPWTTGIAWTSLLVAKRTEKINTQKIKRVIPKRIQWLSLKDHLEILKLTTEYTYEQGNIRNKS